MLTPKYSQADLLRSEKLLKMAARRCMIHQKCRRTYQVVAIAAIKHIKLFRVRHQNKPYFDKRAETLNEMFERQAMQENDGHHGF